MPAPRPLTACEPPRLDWSRPQAPAATDFDDIYFSVDGGLAETEAVYLRGCGLPERWADRRHFVIGELGFGSGLNVLAAWRMWETSKPDGGHLHIISIEKFPFDASQMAKAASAWPELELYAGRLIALWPGRVKGSHILHLAPDVTLTLVHDDVLSGLKSVSAKVDAWFMDGFSPAKNPDMWSSGVMAQMGRLSAPRARVGTFTVAGHVREGLKAAGFDVAKKPGFGRKRQRLEAIFTGSDKAPVLNLNPIIIGAGIAGACLARSFLRRGVVPVVIDSNDGSAASGNPAAIVKPRLDLQDRPESRFFLSSYLYALQAYHADGTVLSEGVFHAAKAEPDLARFEKLAAQAALPLDHMHRDIGPFGLEGLMFPKALVIDPVKTCEAFLGETDVIKGRAERYEREGDIIHVFGTDGCRLASGSHVFLAAGAGIRDLKQGDPLALRYSRGQITAAQTDVMSAITYGGYALPLDGYTLLGATHDRVSGADPYAVKPEDDAENIKKFETLSGQKAVINAGKSRASVRVTQASTLPLIAANENVTALTALGSRGFVFAPLLSEHIAAKALSEPYTDYGKI